MFCYCDALFTWSGVCSMTEFHPLQQKRKLRIYISNTCTPGKPEGEEIDQVSSWELRMEGKLLEDVSVDENIAVLTIEIFCCLVTCKNMLCFRVLAYGGVHISHFV